MLSFGWVKLLRASLSIDLSRDYYRKRFLRKIKEKIELPQLSKTREGIVAERFKAVVCKTIG